MISPTDKAYKMLRDKILSGELRPAQRLVETKLVKEFGISRSHLRTAFQRLSFDGLIELQPNQGAMVSDLTLPDILDVFVAREALELEAYKRALIRMDAASITRLETLVQKMKEAIAKDDYELYSSSAMQFRTQILEHADSRQLKEIASSLLLISSRVVLRKIMIPLRGKRSLAEHEEIMSAIKDGHEENLEVAFRNHIANLKADIEKYWDIVRP